MAKLPPLLPTETLARVLRTARVNGTSVLVIAGTLALLSAAARDVFGTGVGLLVAAAGAIELHGAGLVRQGQPRGTSWLVTSQLYLLLVVLAYVAWRITHYDEAFMRTLVTMDMEKRLSEAGLTVDDFMPMLRKAYVFAYAVIAVATFIYQGGMALYYNRRRGAVDAALREEF